MLPGKIARWLSIRRGEMAEADIGMAGVGVMG